MGRVTSKHINIYVTAGFKATWEKYLEICERDGLSASREIRKYIKAQVDRREPGNPQRPLTAYVDGHEDAVRASWAGTLKDLVARAERRRGVLPYVDVVATLRAQGLEGGMLVARAGSMCESMKALGVSIVY